MDFGFIIQVFKSAGLVLIGMVIGLAISWTSPQQNSDPTPPADTVASITSAESEPDKPEQADDSVAGTEAADATGSSNKKQTAALSEDAPENVAFAELTQPPSTGSDVPPLPMPNPKLSPEASETPPPQQEASLSDPGQSAEGEEKLAETEEKPASPQEAMLAEVRDLSTSVTSASYNNKSGNVDVALDLESASVTTPSLSGLLGLTITRIAEQVSGNEFGRKKSKRVNVHLNEAAAAEDTQPNSVLFLSWRMSDLRKVKWDEAISSDVMALASKKSNTPEGKRLVAEFCGTGYTKSRICK